MRSQGVRLQARGIGTWRKGSAIEPFRDPEESVFRIPGTPSRSIEEKASSYCTSHDPTHANCSKRRNASRLTLSLGHIVPQSAPAVLCRLRGRNSSLQKL